LPVVAARYAKPKEVATQFDAAWWFPDIAAKVAPPPSRRACLCAFAGQALLGCPSPVAAAGWLPTRLLLGFYGVNDPKQCQRLVNCLLAFCDVFSGLILPAAEDI
jgi:hypothetical protein